MIVVVIMVMIAAVFAVDRYYWVLQSGAVERALDLEQTAHPAIRITKSISDNSLKAVAGSVVLVLYVALLACAFGLGLVTVGSGAIRLVQIVGALCVVAIIAYFLFTARACGTETSKSGRTW